MSVDSMAVYRGMDIGTAKPDRRVRAEVPYHLLDLVDPSEEFTVQQFQPAARQALADIAGRAARALLVGGTGLYLRALVDDLTFPGRFPRWPRRSPPSWTRRARGERRAPGRAAPAARPAGRARPGGRRPDRADQRRRLLRALEVTIGSGQPFSSFGPGLERYPPTPVGLIGVRRRPGDLDRRIAERFDHLMERACSTRSARLAARPGGCHGRPGRHSATASCWPTSRTVSRSPRPSRRPSGGPGPSPAGSGHGSGAIPVSCGWTPTTTRWVRSSRAGGPVPGGPDRWETDGDTMTTSRRPTPAPPPHQAPWGRQRLSGPVDLDGGRPLDPRPGARPCATAASGSAPTGSSGSSTAAAGPTWPWTLRNADGSVAEMSGNGMRCLAQAAVEAGLVTPPTFTVDRWPE